MANLEDIIRDLREKNSELVQKVQDLKMADAQKAKENLELMKENNELRLKLSRLKSGGAAQAHKLNSELQSASAEALSHLVQASGAIARSIELAKQYMRDRQELEAASPRWSAVSGSPATDKVHRVPPLLLGGQSIQPVVTLSRTMLDSSTRSLPRTPTQNNSSTERAVPIPMHMLQDLYIPLQRIDAAELQGDISETELEADVDDLNESAEQSLEEDSKRVSRLEAVAEELETTENNNVHDTTTSFTMENPLEGPSWLLDVANNLDNSNAANVCRRPPPRPNFEPDSTTHCDDSSSQTQDTLNVTDMSNVTNTSNVTNESNVTNTPNVSKTPNVTRTSDVTNTSKVSKTPNVTNKSKVSKTANETNTADVTNMSDVINTPKVSTADVTNPHDVTNTPNVTNTSMASTPDMATSKCDDAEKENTPRMAFTPTVRRRKRTSTPPPLPPRHSVRKRSSGGRVLKVVVAKMSLSEQQPHEGGDCSPPKRTNVRDNIVHSDAPSPNGTTHGGVVVTKSNQEPSDDPSFVANRSSRRTARAQQSRDSRSRSDSRSRDSDSCAETGDGDGRTRRARKQVSYKEKPLNRKLRR